MNEKEFAIYSEGYLFRLKWKGGGEMPASLQGSYTSYRDAKQAGEKYKASRKPKKVSVKNAKDNTGT